MVNSYPSTPLNIAIEVPEFDPDTYHDAVKNHHLKEMRSHALKYGIPENKCVVREGLPEKVIPQVAKRLDAELDLLCVTLRNRVGC